ncbi:hypothetical protein VTN31DRAFT_2130 [Thermomyces dupontii]|uniref:uncharacterized protein n=1 Tax=Talaromyces thermophilus TaxID=28565 RepID=UPI003742C0CA
MSRIYAKDQPAGFTNRIRNVAIVGPGGSMGRHIAQELVKTGQHVVTGLSRKGSSSKIPDGVKAVYVDYEDEARVVDILRGQDFLIITQASQAPTEQQSKLIKAAGKAGIKYIIPNVFGIEYTNEEVMKDIPGAIERTVHVHKEIEEIGASWINIVSSFWYQHSLALGPEAFGFDFNEKRITFYDDGNAKINTSTLPQCGRAVAALLSLKIYPDDEKDESLTLSGWLNGPLLVSSFLVSQKDMFESWKRVSGDKDSDWKIEYESTRERYDKGVERMKQGDPMGWAQLLYARLFASGDGNYQDTLGLHNELLGLPVEDLDEQTRLGKETVESGYSYKPISKG